MRALSFCALMFVPLAATAQSAPARYVPPIKTDVLENQLHVIPQATVAAYMGYPRAIHVFDSTGDAIEVPTAKGEGNTIGYGVEVGLAGTDLFGEATAENGAYVHLSAITSVGAAALRVQVSLAALDPADEVWAIDPVGLRAFGPFTRTNTNAAGHWLPTLEGDTAVLLARTTGAATPSVVVSRLSHVFTPILEAAKELPCNLSAVCDNDGDIVDAVAALGWIVRTGFFGNSGICSGSLINNADTNEDEPYFMTSNHCVPALESAAGIDVIWDFRPASCGGPIPPLASLPRSNGEEMLATSRSYDITLVKLNTVPVGTFGRLYLGWDSSAPSTNDPIVVLHHPDGAFARVSKGRIINTSHDNRVLGYVNQIEVIYDEGVTEGGSSGSPLLYEDTLQFAGTLSNGPFHTCGGDDNTDAFSAFHLFFPTIEDFLTGTNPPPPIPPTRNCPVAKTLEDQPEAVARIREFRDEWLEPYAPGRVLIAAYYRMAPAMTEAVQTHSEARDAIRLALHPFMAVGSHPGP
jgi:hypothetical protein